MYQVALSTSLQGHLASLQDALVYDWMADVKNRDYRECAPDTCYHIYNRGNGKQDIFLDNQDFGFFLFKLRQNIFPGQYKNHRTPPLPENSFSLISYCLMPNHFHFLLRQNDSIPTGRLVSRISTGYSKYFNKKYAHVGHVFQDQFKQIAVDKNEYLLWLSAYIHQNPKVAGLVKDPIDYEWSSYRHIMAGDIRDKCDPAIVTDQFKTIWEYKNFVDDSFSIIKEKKDLEHLLLDQE